VLRGRGSQGIAGNPAPHGYGKSSVSKGFVMPNGADALLKAVTVGDTLPAAGAQRRLGAASAPPHKDRTKASAVWATSEGMLGAAAPGLLAKAEAGTLALSRAAPGTLSNISSAKRRSKGAVDTAAEAAAFAAAAGRGAGSGGLRPWTAEGTEGAATGSGAADEYAVGAWDSVGSSGRRINSSGGSGGGGSGGGGGGGRGGGRGSGGGSGSGGGGGREQKSMPTPVLTGRRRSGSGGGSDGGGGGGGPASGYGTGSGVGVGRLAGNANASGGGDGGGVGGSFSCGVPGREGGGFSGGGVLGGARPAAGLGLALGSGPCLGLRLELQLEGS
jgi:hypothetical protein